MQTTQTQQISPAPLSNKMGINTTKKTQLQQGMLQAISMPMMNDKGA